MFYFLLQSSLIWHYLLIAAAILPAVFLMVRVYRTDRIEKESPSILFRCVRSGVIATLIAMVAERILGGVLDSVLDARSDLYQVILYFIIVAGAEEGAKNWMLRRSTWNDGEFDCLYDGVVYAVFVSLGFALWENISYVLHFGLQGALIRAVTAVPGHCCFGVFMGVFYGKEKLYCIEGDPGRMNRNRSLGLLIPILLHGAYDYIASMESNGFEWMFLVFIALLYFFAWKTVGRASVRDRFI